jgi:hypothetical protein
VKQSIGKKMDFEMDRIFATKDEIEKYNNKLKLKASKLSNKCLIKKNFTVFV